MERIKELEEVEKLLETVLEVENGNLLANQLVNIEAWGNRVSYMLYSAREELDQKKRQALPPKSSQYTDVDRKITLEGLVSTYQSKADYLDAVQSNIHKRISLGQTLLKNMRTELESNVTV